MAKQSLEYSLSSLNPSFFNNYDTIIDKLSKVHALIHVALSEHFSQCGQLIVYEYLSTLEDLVLQTKEMINETWMRLENEIVINLAKS
jgi:hypothetical protein